MPWQNVDMLCSEYCHLPPDTFAVTLHYTTATYENFSVSTTTAWITLITVSWSSSACTQHHVDPGELN